jgi:hypothetical protein
VENGIMANSEVIIQIVAEDSASATIKKVEAELKTLNTTAGSLSKVGNVFGPMSTSAEKMASSTSKITGQTNALSTSLIGASNSAQKVSESTGRIGQASTRSAISTGGLVSSFSNLARMMVGFAGISAMFSFAQEIMGASNSLATLDGMFNTLHLSQEKAIGISTKYGVSLEGISEMAIKVSASLKGIGEDSQENMEMVTEAGAHFATYAQSMGRSGTQINREMTDVMEMLSQGKFQAATTVLKGMNFTQEQIDSLAAMKGNVKGFSEELNKIIDQKLPLDELFKSNPEMAMNRLKNKIEIMFAKILTGTMKSLLPLINGLFAVLDNPAIEKFAQGLIVLAAGFLGLWVALAGVNMIRNTISELTMLGSTVVRVAKQVSGADLGGILGNLGGKGKKGKNVPIGTDLPTPDTKPIEKWSTTISNTLKSAVSMITKVVAGAVVILAAIAAAMVVLWASMEMINMLGGRYAQIEGGFKKGTEAILATMMALASLIPVLAAIAILGIIADTGVGLVGELAAIGAGTIVIAVALTSAMANIAYAATLMAAFGATLSDAQIAIITRTAQIINMVAGALTSLASAMGALSGISWNAFLQFIIPIGVGFALDNAFKYIKIVADKISKAVVPDVQGKDFSGAASTIVSSCNSLTNALNDVSAAYSAIPDVRGDPSTSRITNGINYLKVMTEAFRNYKPPSEKDKTPGHDAFPILPIGLLGATPDDNLVNEITSSVKNKINVNKSLDVNIVVNHVSEDNSIDTYQVVSNLREYQGGIFTDRQLSKLAKDIGRFA